MMERTEFEQHVGKSNICGNIQEALNRAQVLHSIRGKQKVES